MGFFSTSASSTVQPLPQGKCHRCVLFFLRWMNIVLLVVGVAVTSYGIYLAASQSGLHTLSTIVLVVGIINVVFPISLIGCGNRYRHCLHCNIFVQGFMLLGEAIAGIVFLTGKGRKKIIDNAPDNQSKSWLNHHLKVSAYVLFAVAAVQLLALIMAYVRSQNIVDTQRDDPEDYDESGRKLLSEEKDKRKAEKDQERKEKAAARQYEKNKDIYERYGRRPKGDV